MIYKRINLALFTFLSLTLVATSIVNTWGSNELGTKAHGLFEPTDVIGLQKKALSEDQKTLVLTWRPNPKTE